MGSRKIWIPALVLLALLAAGGIWWYVSVPHSPEQQFAAAEAMERDLRADALAKSPKELADKIDRTVDQYQRVWTRFGLGPKNPKAAEAMKKIAKIQEEVAKDDAKAIAALDQLGKEYPDEDNAGFALIDQARLIRKAADALKADKPDDAAAKYREALAKLDDFRKKFDKSKNGDAALMEIGRIWQDGLSDPLIRAIEVFTQVLKDYPRSTYEPEAMLRLARQYEKIKEYDQAIQIYAQLIEQYPKSKEAADALDARGRLLADKQDKHDEAAKDFDKFAQDFPDDPRASSARQDARSEKQKAASDEGQNYGKSRYGGTVPLDTTDDKALPPAELLKQFTAQKLDAEKYDLNVTFEPKEHHITVEGTLKLANRGAEKKELLLMLGTGLDVSKLTVDGAAAQSIHKNDTWKVSLPAPLAEGAETTLGFTYGGYYADAKMMKDYQPGSGGGMKGSRPAPPGAGGDTSELKGKPAPNISLKTLDGKSLSLADQRGKVVVVDFWATWCPPCRESLPHLQSVSANKALKDEGLVVWAVDDEEKSEDVEKYLKDNKMDFTVLMDESGAAEKDYKVQGIPTTVIIGRDGVIKNTFLGWGGESSAKAIDDAIAAALAEKAPEAGGALAQAPATKPAAEPPTSTAPEGASMPPTTQPNYTMDPQMALGDYGYALSGASWYPITIIGDVFDAHVTLNTPANMEAVTNGEVVRRDKSTEAGKEGHFEFNTRNPVFGLYFAYGPYTVQEKQVGPIHFYTYFRPENASKHEAYVEVANRILSFYADKFDGFPYEKMAIIDTPLPTFLGGVGPASMMFLQQTMVDHPEVPENLLAHELAHQWFGNLIPINITDPGYSQWLSEGFATYCDALYTEHKDGIKAFNQHIVQYEQLYFQFAMLAPKGSGAIKDMTTMASSLYRPVVYEKGALVLHMLRKVMGDDKFFKLLLTYVQQYKNKPSTVDDFRHLADDINGSDLSWFFGEWFDRSVFAHWKVAADVTPESGGGATTKVTITQPDDLVVMPADITFLSSTDDRFIVRNVMLDKKENILTEKTPFAPVKIIVDEDGWVLKRLGGDNIWTAKPSLAK